MDSKLIKLFLYTSQLYHHIALGTEPSQSKDNLNMQQATKFAYKMKTSTRTQQQQTMVINRSYSVKYSNLLIFRWHKAKMF